MSGKGKASFKIDDKDILDGHGSHEYARQIVKNLPPISVKHETYRDRMRRMTGK